MGHKIHPDKFRLGGSKDWQYQVRDPLLTNVFLHKTVRNLFLQYSAPYVSYAIRRNVNPRELFDEELKIRMINNPFLRNSLIFSHLNVSYAPSLLLAIFLLDSDAEHRRAAENQREKSLYYLSGSFPRETRHTYDFFRKSMHIINPVTIQDRKASNWRTYFRFYRTGLGRSSGKTKQVLSSLISKLKERYPRFFLTRKSFKKTYKSQLFILSQLPYKYFPAWISSNYSFFYLTKYYENTFEDLRILLFLLRYLKHIKYRNYKSRLFFYNLLFKSLTSCLYLLIINNSTTKRKAHLQTVIKKLVYLKSILFIQLTKYKNVYLQYNKKLFQSRLLLFNLYAKILLFTVRKTTHMITDRQVIIKFYALHNQNLSAQFLVNYIGIKLGQYFDLNTILNPIIRRFKRQDSVNGFRFIITGRLTRKERAACIVKSYASMPLASSSIRVDYAFDFKIMRFGVVGIRIYLLTNEDKPYYYFFEFKNKL
jgi:hypothetical protein